MVAVEADGGVLQSKTKQAVRSLLPQAVLNWREARYFEKYGEVEMHLVDLLCRRDQDAIDIGANCGGYVLFMQRHARRVIAFEPMPDFARLLRGKFAKNVVVHSIALSDSAGEVKLYVPLIDGVKVGGCSTISSGASATYAAHDVIEARMDRLDDVYKGTVGFIKIDVEGHEQAVLEGAVATIRRCRPRMLVEIEERMSAGGVARAAAFFARLGYRGYYVHAARLRDIESFSAGELQQRSDVPDMTVPLRARSKLDNYIYNFLFLPPGEPDATVRRIRERLAGH
jgi:FkbM family methyltransferase